MGLKKLDNFSASPNNLSILPKLLAASGKTPVTFHHRRPCPFDTPSPVAITARATRSLSSWRKPSIPGDPLVAIAGNTERPIFAK
jgi:hypothetical protein